MHSSRGYHLIGPRFHKWVVLSALEHQTHDDTSNILVDRIHLGRAFKRHVLPQHRVKV
jgi:hypothetical protein